MAELALLTPEEDRPLVPGAAVGPALAPADPDAPPTTAAAGRERPAPRARRIELAPYDIGCALALERELGISHVLAQVLVRRGLRDPGAVRELLDPQERHDPSAFGGIDTVLGLIGHHLRAGSRITVHGDYDVDGVCATAVLVRALRSLGGDIGFYIPSRSEDGYGLSAGTVRRLAATGTRLLITVDCGITAVEEVTAARAAGLDVIVTDHHSPRPDGQLPSAPLLHPSACGYPYPHLCGAAVAHKLALALDAPTAGRDVELVALATVADLMPLHGENRRLVREGLAQLAATERPGLRALMEVSGTDPSGLDAGALGFRLAPRINATGRLRRADAALELLLTDDPLRAREIALELDGLNHERRAVEQRIGWEAERLVAELGERPAYVLAAGGWHPGVIGIVASRIVERYHRPTVLIALDGDGPGQGSGRSIPGFDLLAALDAAGEHLIRYGGHRAAAGLTVLPERVAPVREAIEEHAERVLTPALLEPVERIDAIVSGGQLSLSLAEELLALEPCGIGNPGVNLLVAGARFENVRPMGGEGRHARFTVSSGGARAAAVAFGCDGRVPAGDGRPVDASFRLERNVWRGVVEPRLVLRHAAACCPAAIGVLGEPRVGEYLPAVLAELDRPLAAPGGAGPGGVGPDGAGPGGAGTAVGGAGDRGSVTAMRVILDRRGESPLAVLADARAAAEAGGGRLLAVCADVPRRLPGLAERVGGFSLIAHDALADDPAVAAQFEQLVVLDPPTSMRSDAILRTGAGYTHFCWGDAELRFAEQIHELEYGLRASLVALYRGLRLRGRASGEELEHLLRGDHIHPRSARLAGRLIRVLAELELVSLDRGLPALALAGARPTELERSAAYRVYSLRYEEGQRFLNRARPRRRT